MGSAGEPEASPFPHDEHDTGLISIVVLHKVGSGGDERAFNKRIHGCQAAFS